MAMIEVKNITKKYGDLTVLNDFSVDFDQSGVTVLLGPSGTGKSTLLRCINGLETVDSGDIIVDGLSVNNKKNLKQIRTTCGMVFQQTVIFPHLNVIDNLTLSPMKILGMKKAEAEDLAHHYLEKVGLADRGHSVTTSFPAVSSSVSQLHVP